ncbi:hypothetical protein BC834DRAFT_858375 [Gloeopeniophorella convolvens]|nr:hypothetical protein BC834DRAFT_858375 [Gloeopeniophorella convolvens]
MPPSSLGLTLRTCGLVSFCLVTSVCDAPCACSTSRMAGCARRTTLSTTASSPSCTQHRIQRVSGAVHAVRRAKSSANVMPYRP